MIWWIHTVMSMDKQAKGLKAVLYICVSKAESKEEKQTLADEINRCATCAVQREMEVVGYFVDTDPEGTLSLSHPNFLKAIEEIEAGRANALIIITQKGVGEDADTLMQISIRVSMVGGKLFFDHYLSFDEPNGNSENGNSQFINAISPRTPKAFQEARIAMMTALYKTVIDIMKANPDKYQKGNTSGEETPNDEELAKPKPKSRPTKRKRVSKSDEDTKSRSIAKKKVLPTITPTAIIFY